MFEIVEYNDVVERLRAGGSCIGVVREPNAYHAWKAELEAEFRCPVVSKSGLADFAASPFKHHYKLMNRVKEESKALAFGSAVDCLVLTPDVFPTLYAVEEIDRRTKAGKERAAELDAQGLAVLKPEEYATVKATAERALGHLAGDGLILGHSFRSQVGMWALLAELDEVPLATPMLVCGMIDICPDEGGRLIDLKTTSTDVEDAQRLGWTLEDYRYGLQAAIYLDLFNLCTGEERDTFDFLFVNAGPPAMSRMMRLDAGVIEAYRTEYCALIKRYATTWKLGEWGDATLPMVHFVPSRKEAAKLMDGEKWEGGEA